MEVNLHTRNCTIGDDFREMVTDKVSKAGRVYDELRNVDVELIEETNPRLHNERFRMELTTVAAGRMVRIHSSADTREAALDQASERFVRQLRRLKERLIDRGRKGENKEWKTVKPGEDFDEEMEIVKIKQFVIKPMTPAEAALQMELLDHDFFFFKSADTDQYNVIYRRKSGRLGLIEPA